MEKLPVYFIPHGGGPWHVMDDAFGDPVGYGKLREYLEKLGQTNSQKIKAILVISAHWEEDFPTVHFGTHPPLLYDYYGFPESTYHLNWPAFGNAELAERVENLIKANDFTTKREFKRGYDHGTFVPLMIAFPKPKIPVIQLSLVKTLDPETHIILGKALEPLRMEGVLIIGSGMSYHNMRGFMAGGKSAVENSEKFDNWLAETVTNPNVEERSSAMINWQKAPAAIECHPRSEHLLPLFIVTGAAGNDTGKTDYSGTLMGVKISGYKFE
ncbi:MAG: dioxygenase [Bacteroidetes bacterium HGW-Bacteroidetes-4]|jgi:aromatic ring-opening dioxygenase catalytic subunit (LigB family)|nr:MAG: dioxygenase [Bacteroidetes bacterium HGW-Bacteroidetes-4]